MSGQDQDQDQPQDTHMVIVHRDDGSVQGTAFRAREPEAGGGRLQCTWDFAMVHLGPDGQPVQPKPPAVDDDGKLLPF